MQEFYHQQSCEGLSALWGFMGLRWVLEGLYGAVECGFKALGLWGSMVFWGDRVV